MSTSPLSAGGAGNVSPPSDPQVLLDRYHASLYRAIDAVHRIPKTTDGLGSFLRQLDYVDNQLGHVMHAIGDARKVVREMHLVVLEDDTELEPMRDYQAVNDLVFEPKPQEPEGGAA